MIELLILHTLNSGIYTMYGINKHIETEFSVFLTPSIGTIKPALKRLEAEGFVNTQKTMSKGGRPSTYYAITNKGKAGLKHKLLEPIRENPVQFLTNARLRIYCASILDLDDFKNLINLLKTKAESIYVQTQKQTEKDAVEFCQHMVYENINCEYKNLISLLEGMTRAGNR